MKPLSKNPVILLKKGLYLIFTNLYLYSINSYNGVNGLKRVIIFCLLLFLTGCVQVSDSSHISEAEVVEAFYDNNVRLAEEKSQQEEIFSSKINGVKPGIYELNKKYIYIYEFDTPNNREDGKKVFVEKTASMNLVSYSSFEKRNILIFYVHGEDLNTDSVPFEKEIQEALDRLIEG